MVLIHIYSSVSTQHHWNENRSTGSPRAEHISSRRFTKFLPAPGRTTLRALCKFTPRGAQCIRFRNQRVFSLLEFVAIVWQMKPQREKELVISFLWPQSLERTNLPQENVFAAWMRWGVKPRLPLWLPTLLLSSQNQDFSSANPAHCTYIHSNKSWLRHHSGFTQAKSLTMIW